MLPGAGFYAQLFGECPDEPVAGAVAEVIVDRLQPVEVEVQNRDRTGPPHCEPVGKMGDQRAAVVQTGQIVVLGEVAKLLFGCDPCLKLRKQRGDGLDRVELVGPPLLATKFHAGELAGRDSPRDQWCRGRRGRRDLWRHRGPSGRRRRQPSVRKQARLGSGRITTKFFPCSHSAKMGSALLKCATVWGSGPASSRRGGHAATNLETLILWSLCRKNAASISRCWTSSASTCSFTSPTVEAVVSINRVATMVTKLRAKLSSDVVRGSGCRVGFRAWGIERLSNPVSMVGAAVEKRKYIQNEAAAPRLTI